jgi:serpin B
MIPRLTLPGLPWALVRRVVVATVVVGVLVTACGAPSGREVRSAAPAEQPDRATLTGGVAAANAFAFDLAHALGQRDGNSAIAPYPVARSLAMARVGARTDTRAALDRALHADLSTDLDVSFATIDAMLAERSGDQRSSTRKGTIDLAMPSSPWLQEEIRFSPDYLDALARYYDSGVRVADFRSEPDNARDAINQWASSETDGVIDLLVPRGEVSDFTRFVTASAGTVHAPWAVRFEPTATRRAPFTLDDGRPGASESMTVQDVGTIRSVTGADFEAVELPYLGGDLSMLVVVPGAGQFSEFASRFDQSQLDSIVHRLRADPIELHLPRFQFTSVLNLDDELRSMGLADVFSPERADFSGITAGESLAISDVVHGTYAAADEEGTDGDAVTVVPPNVAPTGSAPVMTIDRPFIFVVRDDVTGLILQIGRVLEPQT